MPNNRTPLEKAVATGQVINHPARFSARSDPAVAPLPPEPPEWMTLGERVSFATLAGACPWARLSDGPLIALAATLHARMVIGEITSADRGQLIRCLALMGMPPADRSRVTMPDGSDDDDGM